MIEEENTKDNKYGYARLVWPDLSRTFDPTTGAYNTIVSKKFDKCELYDVTINPKEWITDIELLREYLQIPEVRIDNPEIMPYILLNLPEEYQTIVEIL